MNSMIRLLTGLVVLLFAANSSACDFRTTLLAGYECHEQDHLTVSTDPGKYPNLTVTWPVLAGENGVPPATQGDHVLKMQWTNEPKVEVRHDWTDFTFDLTDGVWIHVDVYVADENALPGDGGVGLYDSNWPPPFRWLQASCEPVRTNEWRTISICTAGLTQPNQDHIAALVFDRLAGLSGTIYLDNLRLGLASEDSNCLRRIPFAGYSWSILQSEWPMGTGPNLFTDHPDDVWVDHQGLHLSIVYKDPNWYCSEALANANMGYGKYVFTVQAPADQLDPNIVLGLFIFDHTQQHEPPREIDFELSRWWDPQEPNNAQFVVQPWRTPGNRYRFSLQENRTTTHEITWTPRYISCRSYFGHYPLLHDDDLVTSWTYTGDDIPPAGNETPRLNLWLLPPQGTQGIPGSPPSNSHNAHVVIKDFLYLPLPTDFNADKIVDLQDFAVFAYDWLTGAE